MIPLKISRYPSMAEQIVDDKVILVAIDLISEEIFDVMNKINYKPDYIVNTLFSNYRAPNNECIYCVPLILEHQQKLLVDDTLVLPTDVNTTACFNFNINKKQINRHLTIKLVEWFNLNNFNYTWAGVDQYHNQDEIDIILTELNSISRKWNTDSFKSKIQEGINIIPNWLTVNTNEIKNNSSVVNYGSNKEVWNNGLQKIISTSSVSLINESVVFHHGAAFTEKTLFAMLGLTFPIWIGGFNQASEWKKIGFDIFEDVIDHSYQNCNTLIERCYKAFADNIEILSDLEKSKTLRKQHFNRLLANQKLAQTDHITRYRHQQLEKYPKILREVFNEVAQRTLKLSK